MSAAASASPMKRVPRVKGPVSPTSDMPSLASPAVRRAAEKQLDREAIARLAYSYWAARGYTGGSAEEDWLRAENDLRSN